MVCEADERPPGQPGSFLNAASPAHTHAEFEGLRINVGKVALARLAGVRICDDEHRDGEGNG